MVALFQSQDLNEHPSLGPVENLESYVKTDWWQYLFNANYLKTDGDVVEDETITKSEIDLFVNILNPDKQSAILDLCCGQGRHSLELAKPGFDRLSGLDRSNPNPGWCWDGHLAKMAQIADISYVQMLGKILDAGETRIAKQNQGR